MANTDANSFLKRMQPVWDELGMLVDHARRIGVRRMSSDDLARLDRLYRMTTVHLAQVRSRTTNQALLRNLNSLVAKAHSLIYVSPKRQLLRRVIDFYVRGFPQLVARTARFHVAAVALFLVGAALGWLATTQRPAMAYAFFPAQEVRVPGASAEQLEAVLRHGRDKKDDEKLWFASFLLTHNTKVGFTACTTGVLACVPTVILMVVNGILLGAFAAVHYQQGVVAEMWAWILPHGVTEILAVLLCGGAGLMLGFSVIAPGFEPRRQRMARGGRDMLKLAMGVVPMFVFA